MTKPKANRVEHNYTPIDAEKMYVYVRYPHIEDRAELVISHGRNTCISYLLTKEQEAAMARILTDRCLTSFTSLLAKSKTG